MRALVLACLLIMHAGIVCAQEPRAKGPSGVTVIRHSWSKERINWEINPPRSPYSSADVRGQVDINRQIGDKDRALRSRTPRPRYAFLYKFSFRNTSAKTIKTIAWDYVFMDAETGEELGRRRFIENQAIRPGKSRKIARFLAAPPTHRISVYALGEKERDGLREHVIIKRVVYLDGTEWQSDESVNLKPN